MLGITTYAVYVPRHRLDRSLIAKAWGTAQPAGQLAVANYDEDAMTMAAEAVAQCAPATAAHSIDGLYFASVSSPYREKQISSFLATACDLPRTAQTADFAGSVRASMSAMVAAVHALQAGARDDVVVAAADVRLAQPDSEMEGVFGDAAAAVRFGRGSVIAEYVDMASVSEEFTHLWRTDATRFVQAFPGKFSNTYGYGKDLGEAIRTVLQRQGRLPGDIAKLALYAPDARAAADLAKELGFDPKRQLVTAPLSAVGSAGNADALLALAIALETAKAGDWILVGGYGEGADVLLFRVTDEVDRQRPSTTVSAWLDASVPLPSYEKFLKYRRILEVEEPGEAINNVLEYKELRQDVRLYGSRCSGCGMVQYPVAQVCIGCKARGGLVEHKIGKEGSVFTFTIDHLIANVEHPLPMAVVDMEGGGRLYLQVTDFVDGEVEVGHSMTLTFRRLHEGGGKYNYYWKARPKRATSLRATGSSDRGVK